MLHIVRFCTFFCFMSVCIVYVSFTGLVPELKDFDLI